MAQATLPGQPPCSAPAGAADLGKRRRVLLKWGGGRRFASEVGHLWNGGVRAWMKLVNLLLSQQRPLIVDRQLVGFGECFDEGFLGLLLQWACQVLQLTAVNLELFRVEPSWIRRGKDIFRHVQVALANSGQRRDPVLSHSDLQHLYVFALQVLESLLLDVEIAL